jgi:hypothetical protein
MKAIVMFSGGIGSFVAAHRAVEEYGAANVTLLFSDVRGDSVRAHVGEDEDTYRFIEDAVEFLGCGYVRVADGRDIWQVFRDKRYIGNSRLAQCSHLLKQAPARKWLAANTTAESHVVILGIDWTESHRIEAIRKNYGDYATSFPLLDTPLLSKSQMIAFAKECGIEPPRLYAMGFAHNNCGGGCVRSGQGQFKRLLDVMPERFAVWEAEEQKLRDMLGDVSILREQRDGLRRRLTLAELRQRSDAQIDLLDIGGCGCFVDSLGT